MTPCCYLLYNSTRSFILEQRKITVALPNRREAVIVYHKTSAGDWVSVVSEQSIRDLTALLNGEELGQEYVNPNAGDIPPWVTL